MYFDSHAHLTSPQLIDDVHNVIDRALKASVTRIVNICTDRASLEAGLELSKRHPGVFNAGSTTPHDVEKEGEELFPLFEKHARAGDFVAIGETGLDYHYEHSPRQLQQEFLRRYLALATSCKLPVIIHCREAFEDLFRILDETYQGSGVLHCFTGSSEEARQVVARGWYVSFSGILTFKRSEALREAAKEVPLERLFIETDAPFLAPQSHRGQTNEPAYVAEVCAVLASVKGVSAETVAQASYKNASSLFKVGISAGERLS